MWSGVGLRLSCEKVGLEGAVDEFGDVGRERECDAERWERAYCERPGRRLWLEGSEVRR